MRYLLLMILCLFTNGCTIQPQYAIPAQPQVVEHKLTIQAVNPVDEFEAIKPVIDYEKLAALIAERLPVKEKIREVPVIKEVQVTKEVPVIKEVIVKEMCDIPSINDLFAVPDVDMQQYRDSNDPKGYAAALSVRDRNIKAIVDAMKEEVKRCRN